MLERQAFVTPLPTLQDVGLSPEALSDVSPHEIATAWFSIFSGAITSRDLSSFDELLLPGAVWRDLFALTWDIRSITGIPSIRHALDVCLAPQAFAVRAFTSQELALDNNAWAPALIRPFPDVVWIQMGFTLETGSGTGIGCFRLVPCADGKWRAFAILSNLSGLKGYPSLVRLYYRYTLCILKSFDSLLSGRQSQSATGKRVVFGRWHSPMVIHWSSSLVQGTRVFKSLRDFVTLA